MSEASLINALQETVAKLTAENLDLKRHNQQLREAIDALMQPAPSELLEKNRQHPSRR